MCQTVQRDLLKTKWDMNTHETRRDILIILLWKRVKDDARCYMVKILNSFHSIYIFLPAQ